MEAILIGAVFGGIVVVATIVTVKLNPPIKRSR